MKLLTSDFEAWDIVKPEDLWVFDKLLLSRRLGYVCGPKGYPVPKSKKYIIRPCVNLLGMGIGVKYMRLNKLTNHIPDGFFWCEIFKGEHLSIDFIDSKEALCVKGIKSNIHNRWKIWKKVKRTYKLPKIVQELKSKYKYLNIEIIGEKIIEVHFRLNPDFQDHQSPYVKPVYKDEEIIPGEKEMFVFNPDEDRLGFYIQNQKDQPN